MSTTTPMARWMEVPILVAVCCQGPSGRIPETALPRLQRAIDLARAFVFRHSRARLHLRTELLVLDEPRPGPEDFTSGLRWLGEHLPGRVDRQRYAGVFEICPAASGTWSWGVVSPELVPEGPATWFQGLGFAHSDWPLDGHARYPIADPGVDPSLAWVFLHEFQHCLDAMYTRAGVPMGDGDRPWRHRAPCGHHFDYQAWLLHRFEPYLALSPAFGQIVAAPDPDGDGLADDLPELPLDGRRLGALAGRPDTLDLLAGRLYAPGAPISAPLAVPYRRPATLARELAFSTEPRLRAMLAGAWDEQGLSLSLSAPGRATLYLDGSGSGWWCGRDNYELALDLPAGALLRAHAMDVTDECQARREGREWWDDDPAYPFERVLEPGAVRVERRADQVWVHVPSGTAPGAFRAQPGGRLGLSVQFEHFDGDSGWASLFEPWSLQPLVLQRNDE